MNEENSLLKYIKEFKNKKTVVTVVFLIGALLGGYSEEAIDSLGINTLWKADIDNAITEYHETYHANPPILPTPTDPEESDEHTGLTVEFVD